MTCHSWQTCHSWHNMTQHITVHSITLRTLHYISSLCLTSDSMTFPPGHPIRLRNTVDGWQRWLEDKARSQETSGKDGKKMGKSFYQFSRRKSASISEDFSWGVLKVLVLFVERQGDIRLGHALLWFRQTFVGFTLGRVSPLSVTWVYRSICRRWVACRFPLIVSRTGLVGFLQFLFSRQLSYMCFSWAYGFVWK